MLSRVADSLYWMSRYLERAEHTARLVDVNLTLTLDRAPADASVYWGRLLSSLRPPPSTDAPDGLAQAVAHTTVDLSNRASIASCIAAARENARQVREQISSEMWEQINRMFLAVRRSSSANWSDNSHAFLSGIIEGTHLFQGLTNATMAHGEGWQFIELGRYIERASATSSLLLVQFRDLPDQPTEVGQFVEWVGLLRSSCAFEAYCRHYTADVRGRRIAEFLLLNAEFPRSIRYAARHIQTSLRAIGQMTRRGGGRAERLAGRLLASLDYAQIDELMADNFPATLDGIGRQCGQINAAVYQQFIHYPVETALTA
jgi:uncharacterized alpha-E superfamily protein